MRFQCYLHAYGPVDQIEVQVVQFKITEGLLTALPHHRLFVVSAPQLQKKKGNEEANVNIQVPEAAFTNKVRQ